MIWKSAVVISEWVHYTVVAFVFSRVGDAHTFFSILNAIDTWLRLIAYMLKRLLNFLKIRRTPIEGQDKLMVLLEIHAGRED